MKTVWVAIVLLCYAAGRAVEPGDEVIVLFNSRVPESKNLAFYYAEKRHVPRQQVFGFKLPAEENMTRAEFRDSLQRPLASQLESKKLWHIAKQAIPATSNEPERVVSKVVRSSVRYAVLAYGMPLRILEDSNLTEPGAERVRPELRRNGAAVDSELALLPGIEQKLHVTGPLKNPLYTATNAAWFHPSNGVLMVSRLDGPSADIARGLVDKALAAEKIGLWGRTYFDLRKITDPGYKAGDDMILAASEVSRRLGFETVVDNEAGTFSSAFPMSQIAFYAGWYSENADGPFALPNVEFMPGAFAYHLHSYSANTLRSSSRHWVGPFLAKGVTVTMGTIDEPYLSGTPDMSIFAPRFLAGGFTFGEAAYACQAVLSWQTTVVGDPLYKPFRKSADELGHELEQEKSKLVEWYYLRVIDINQVNGRPIGDLVSLLEKIPATASSAVLQEKLADLYFAQGKPASAIHSALQALTLEPSPEQRVRLRLTLGERMLAQGQEREAYENYQALINEFPAFANKTEIDKKLLALAQKLHL